ncbi:DUF1990 family protein [Marisediminicola senii]|uniref:DUF1990 family protein n=1 Tax=Marisediminicola senii TaxID=2711233 RepID=UPI001F194113|nr:DUF1990 domain-containing protein [Marisediminicola senii]
MAGEMPLWEKPVTYGAIGGTKAADLLTYPPKGFRPIERRRRIGHGENRFAWASAQTMSWGIQRLSGFTVDVVDAPAAVTDQTYVPVSFDDDGRPVESVAAETGAGEDTFGGDGTSFLIPGDTATLTIRFLGIPVTAPVRVVYVIDEPNRKGFAYGTLRGHPESGEEAFVVERTDDGSVWLTISAFSRPSAWYWWVLSIPLRIAQEQYTRRYLKVLAGPTD